MPASSVEPRLAALRRHCPSVLHGSASFHSPLLNDTDVAYLSRPPRRRDLIGERTTYVATESIDMTAAESGQSAIT